MPSWGPDLVNKLILFYSILYQCENGLKLFNIGVHLNCLNSIAISNGYNIPK